MDDVMISIIVCEFKLTLNVQYFFSEIYCLAERVFVLDSFHLL